MRDAYIVTSVRTPGCKRKKGAFSETRPEDLMSFILDAAVKKTPGLEKKDVEDILVGCAFPEAEQGMNLGRMVTLMADFPVEVTGGTINRFCSSGLEAITQSAMRVMAGWSDITIGGGVESMSYVPLGGYMPRPHPEWAQRRADLYTTMGITAENVSRRYDVSREDQDEFAYQSQTKAAKARKENLFSEIVPTPAHRYTMQKDGTYKKEITLQDFDDGIRDNTTMEGLAKLNAVFAAGGTVTAGNSSQTTDGAAATVIMSKNKVDELGLAPIAKLVCYTTIGCQPDEMGVGPKYAIPKVFKMADVDINEVGLFEINEAFASQALHCIRALGLENQMEKININGGAIALGHPLGCTGAKLAATLLANMQRTGTKYGVESMCIGGGMGAAALFELCD